MKMLTRRGQSQSEQIGDLLPQPPLAQVASASFAATRSYSQHRVLQAERLGRMGALVGIAGMIAGAAGIACVPILLPLHKTVDRLWIADKSTGVVEQMPSAETAAKEAPQIIDIWFVERFVEAWESWTATDAPSNHDVVEWAASPLVRAQYEALTDTKNPDSPARRLGDKGSITIQTYGHDIRCDGPRCRVRVQFYMWTHRDGDTELPIRETWEADVDYEIRPDLIPAQGRKFNPIGLIVTSYQSIKYPSQ